MEAFEARRAFELKVGEVQMARTAEEFVAASDVLRTEVVRLQTKGWVWPSATYPAILNTAAGRVRGAYAAMPKVEYSCEGKKACSNRGAEVEASYSALLLEMRTYAQKQAFVMSDGKGLPYTFQSFGAAGSAGSKAL